MSLRTIRLSKLASRPGKPGKLPVSPATVWRWSREGRLPAPYKIGPGTTVWDVDEIDSFLEKQAAGSAK